eukprot:SAG22_NODE_718_length_7670_cov_11.194690_4_plen_411_part_00
MLAAQQADAAVLGGAAARAAATLAAGHRVHANLTMGHMPSSECKDGRAGNPRLFQFDNQDHSGSSMGPGDVLWTNEVSPAVLAAHGRGVHVVVFTCPYVENAACAPGDYDNPAGLLPEDVADAVVETHIPQEQGLVHIPEHPAFPCFPASGTGTSVVFWTLAAGVSAALAAAGGGRARAAAAAAAAAAESATAEYLGRVVRLVSALEAQVLAVAQAGSTIAERVLRGRGRLLVRGGEQSAGLCSETHWVATGMWLPDWFDRPYDRPTDHDYLPGPAPLRAAADGGEHDSMIVAAVVSSDPADADFVRQGRACGQYVVGIGPDAAEASLRAAGCAAFLRLGLGPTEEAGLVGGVGPATGVVANVLLQMLLAAVAERLCDAGEVPYFMANVCRKHAEGFNTMMRHFTSRRGF